MSALIDFEIEVEQRAIDRANELIEELAATVVPIWHWGDGFGGDIKNRLQKAIEAKGMRWDEESSYPWKRRKSIPRDVRDIVIARDGLRCVYCKRALTPREVTLDHRVAFINGGSDDPENLCVACKPCNSSKGTLSAEEFLGLHGYVQERI